MHEWSFPYYLIAVVLVGLLPVHGNANRPEAWLLLLPLLYLVHFFYSLSLPLPAQSGQGDKSASAIGVLPTAARLYVCAVLCAGALVLGSALLGFNSEAPLRFAGYLALGLLVSTWKVRLPGMLATVSIGFVVTLFAIA